MEKTGITGGIGAGKSVISRVIRLRGFGVYDCDAEARRIMDSDAGLQAAMRHELGEECVSDCGVIDRPAVARVIFGDESKRLWLNSRVHKAVRDDFMAWTESDANNRYVESAILCESGLDRMCDRIWLVEAPESRRELRAARRDNTPPENVRRRMESQRKELDMLRECDVPVTVINNP